MEKKSWILGIISILFAAAVLIGSPVQAQAKTTGQADTDAYRAVFDASYYYNTYPDLADAFGMNQKALFSHFANYGIREGRSGSADFNIETYRQRYADLEEAFGDNLAAYCRHYIEFGKTEGRSARPDGQTAEAEAAVVTKSASSVKQNIIGTCTTKYDATVPRAKNVELAAQRTNGVIVQPGESFSFSTAILSRTTANGYVTAPIFISGKKGTGIGGGVCQVSSTLYAAMVYAGLPATERHAHSLPVDYLPEGLDATIAGNSMDLRFVNTFSQPLLIQTSVGGGALTVTLVLQ